MFNNCSHRSTLLVRACMPYETFARLSCGPISGVIYFGLNIALASISVFLPTIIKVCSQSRSVSGAQGAYVLEHLLEFWVQCVFFLAFFSLNYNPLI